MKAILPFVLLLAGAGLMPGAIIETINFDLSPLHAGSTLSGTFTLPDSVATTGASVPVQLSFSGPADYSPTSLSSTITVSQAPSSGYTVAFSELDFTNLSGVTTPTNTRDVALSGSGFANCASFPCTASGRFQDRNPPVFTATYTLTPASSVPEPGYALLLLALLPATVFGRRFIRPTRTPSH